MATDLTDSYRAGLQQDLSHVVLSADPFHVVRVANRCLDKIRRRVQNETLGHRGREVYLTKDRAKAGVLLDKAIAGCLADEVPEIVSLGRTLRRWRTEILNYHDTRASNGPTEGLNLCVKKVKRCGHGFLRFDHYRIRVLLHTGGVTWSARPRPPRIRSRHTPH